MEKSLKLFFKIKSNLNQKCRHILDLSFKEKQCFLDSFDIAISDCDGVLWMISSPIPLSGKAINLLTGAGKQIKLLTNNGMRKTQDYINKIKNIGVSNFEKQDIINPVKVIAHYVETNFPNQICYCMASKVFGQELSDEGVKVQNVTPPRGLQLEEVPKYFTPPPNATVAIMDLHVDQSYAEYALAHQFLEKPGCQLFVSSTNTRAPLTPDLTILGPGVFINAFAQHSAKKPIIFGKPSKLMADYIIDKFQISQPRRALLIGDNLSVDMKFGVLNGFQTLFVLSGSHTKDEMFMLPAEEQPDYYADSLGDFVNFFEDMKRG